MGTERKQQLQMLWPERLLASPPEPTLPSGYALRTFLPGDEAEYLNLMGAAGFACDQEALKGYLSRVLPDSLFLAFHRFTGELAATAMATNNPSPLHPFGGELSWVAGSPQHAGKGLGKAVCAAVTARLLHFGYRRICLHTDDWRLAAIKTYLQLGYIPFLFAPDMELRWKTVRERLGWSIAAAEWPRHPETDTVEPDGADRAAGERSDMDTPSRYPRRYQWLPHRPHKGYALSGDVDAFGDESLYRPSQLGTAWAMPSAVVAGETSPLSLTFTAGRAGLSEGAQVTFVMRGQQPLGRRWTGYAVRGPEGCALEPAQQGPGFVLRQGRLSEGESVILSFDPFRWTPLAGRREFKVVIDQPDVKAQQRLPESVIVDLLPKPLARLEAILPCTHRAGEVLALHVTTRDEYDNRVPLTGMVRVSHVGQSDDVPMVAGMAQCNVPAADEALVRAVACLPAAPVDCRSNPSVKADGLQLYIGDLHCHDYLSEAEGYPDEVYRWAIEDRKLDFVSVVPQAHGWLDNETWAICKYMNERHLDEGGFATFLGFEWQHSSYGDKVIHYLGGDQPYLPVDDLRYNSPAKLYQALRASDALIIGHHPGYPIGQWVPGTDFDSVETDVERLVELWSMHGSSEGCDLADRPLVGAALDGGVMTALGRGLRLGFVAGSDTHSARPGGSVKEPRPYRGGLAAVWAAGLTRRNLFRALYGRHTYALTGARIVLKMMVNGALMGSEISACERVGIHIDVWAPGEIKQVQVLKNGRLLQRFGPRSDEWHAELEDQTGGAAFYHCRVTRTDGHLAVCSPVWVG